MVSNKSPYRSPIYHRKKNTRRAISLLNSTRQIPSPFFYHMRRWRMKSLDFLHKSLRNIAINCCKSQGRGPRLKIFHPPSSKARPSHKKCWLWNPITCWGFEWEAANRSHLSFKLGPIDNLINVIVVQRGFGLWEFPIDKRSESPDGLKK